MIPRKLISACITTFVYTPFIYTLMWVLTYAILGDMSIADFLPDSADELSFFFSWGFPFILIYGTLASIISDKLSQILTLKFSNKTFRLILSGIFHVIFALFCYPVFSLLAAVLFFIIDKLLQRNDKTYNYRQGIFVLTLTLATWVGIILSNPQG